MLADVKDVQEGSESKKTKNKVDYLNKLWKKINSFKQNQYKAIQSSSNYTENK